MKAKKLKNIPNKKANVDEGLRSAWDAAKSLVSGGSQTSTQKRVQKQFVKDFVSRASSALKAGIDSESVDPTIAAPTASAPVSAAAPAAAGSAAAATKPTATKPTATKPTSAAPAKAAAPGNVAKPTGAKQGAVKPQVDVSVDNAVNTMRTFQPVGTKVLPPKNVAELNKDLQYVSKNKDYLLRAADKINKFNKAGYDMRQFHKSFMAQHALGKKQQTISEDTYQKLNTIFESILNEGTSIPDFLKKWMATYLKGIDLSSQQATIDKWANQAQKDYKVDGGADAINKLALLAFSAAQAAQPAGARASTPGATSAGTGAATAPKTTATTADPATLLKQLQSLAKTNPNAYAKIKQVLK